MNNLRLHTDTELKELFDRLVSKSCFCDAADVKRELERRNITTNQ